MSNLRDLAGICDVVNGGADIGPLAAKLCSLDDLAWNRLARLRSELREAGEAEGEMILALVVPEPQWKVIASLREAFRQTEDRTAREELRETIVCTLNALAAPTTTLETIPIDALLPGENPDAGKEVEELRKRFHQRYFELKARAGLSTIQEVAQKAGISPTTVHAIEKHAVRPQFRTVRKLAAAFGAPVTDLWPG